MMTETPKRRNVTDTEMRAVLDEHLLLMATLNDKRGTRLDPVFVAEALRAIREGRVTITPKDPPKIMFVEHEDWSDISKVPLTALGLRLGLYHLLRRSAIDTIGLLACHSEAGIRRSAQTANSGQRIIGRYIEELQQKLAEHDLALASDNSGIPLEYFTRHPFLSVFKWWSADNEIAFCKAHGLVTLGDLSKLTIERLQSKPLPPYTAGDGERPQPLDPADPEVLRQVLTEFNFLLRSYGLSEINRHP